MRVDYPMKQTSQSKEDWYRQHVEPHADMIRHWITVRYGEYCEVDDVMQESLMKLFERFEIQPINSPKAFFFSIARNTAVSHIRRSKVRTAESMTDEHALSIIDEEVCIEEEAARNHELEILTKAIQSLPKKCQKVFTLSKVYGMSYQRIADELGISSNTVANQIAIGLSKCTEYMRRNGRN